MSSGEHQPGGESDVPACFSRRDFAAALSGDCASPSCSEGSTDLGAAYLVHLIESGCRYLQTAKCLLAVGSPDPGLARANMAAAQRALKDVDFYLSHIGLEHRAKRKVLAARRRLIDQHRGMSRLCLHKSGRRYERDRTMHAMWRKLGWFLKAKPTGPQSA